MEGGLGRARVVLTHNLSATLRVWFCFLMDSSHPEFRHQLKYWVAVRTFGCIKRQFKSPQLGPYWTGRIFPNARAFVRPGLDPGSVPSSSLLETISTQVQ